MGMLERSTVRPWPRRQFSVHTPVLLRAPYWGCVSRRGALRVFTTYKIQQSTTTEPEMIAVVVESKINVDRNFVIE